MRESQRGKKKCWGPVCIVRTTNRFEVYELEAVNSSEQLEQRSKALFR